MLSAAAVPAVATPPWGQALEAGAHSFHGEHVGLLDEALKVPDAQLEHPRSVVALPTRETYCPAAHTVQLAQQLAGLPS